LTLSGTILKMTRPCFTWPGGRFGRQQDSAASPGAGRPAWRVQIEQ
jgi:hypothetical protein